MPIRSSNALTAAGLALATGDRVPGGSGMRSRGCSRFADGWNARRSRRRCADLCRLRTHARCARGRDRRAAPACFGRLITVFGAGGDRDHGKRAPMGAAAAKASDVVIVTDDNPRGEDPADIRRQVLEGAPQAREIGGRREAILAAIAEAGAEDIVLDRRQGT